MKDWFFFDAAAQLGTPRNGGLAFASTPAELLAEMDRAGVARALVREINASDAGAVYANERMARCLAEDGSGRLDGVWTLLPPQTREIPQGKELFAAMKRHRVRALDLLPAEHRWVASRRTIGRVMGEAAERRVPILVSRAAFDYSWERLYGFLEWFPENRYIFLTTGEPWGIDRQARPLLEAYPHFHMELSTYWTMEGIAELAKDYGAGRFLYGSGYPAFNHGNMMLALRHAELSLDGKLAIAGRNLAGLLDGAEL